MTSMIKASTADPNVLCLVFCGVDTVMTAEPVVTVEGQRISREERSKKLTENPKKGTLTAAGAKTGWVVQQAQLGGQFHAVLSSKGVEVLAQSNATAKVSEIFTAVAERLGYRKKERSDPEAIRQHDIETWVLRRTSRVETGGAHEPAGEATAMDDDAGRRHKSKAASSGGDDRAKRGRTATKPGADATPVADGTSCGLRDSSQMGPENDNAPTGKKTTRSEMAVASTPSPLSKAARSARGGAAVDSDSVWRELHESVVTDAAELLKNDFSDIMTKRGDFFDVSENEHPKAKQLTTFLDNAPAEAIGSMMTKRMRNEAALQKIKDGNEKGQDADDETRRASKELARMMDTLHENSYDWDNVLANCHEIANMHDDNGKCMETAATAVDKLMKQHGLDSAGDETVCKAIKSRFAGAVVEWIRGGEGGLSSHRRRAEIIVIASGTDNFLTGKIAVDLLRQTLLDGQSPALSLAAAKATTSAWKTRTTAVVALLPKLLGAQQVLHAKERAEQMLTKALTNALTSAEGKMAQPGDQMDTDGDVDQSALQAAQALAAHLEAHLATNTQAAGQILDSDLAMRTLAMTELGCELSPGRMAQLVAEMCLTGGGRTVQQLFKFTAEDRRTVFLNGTRVLAATAVLTMAEKGKWPAGSTAAQQRRKELLEADGRDEVSSPAAAHRAQ